MHKPYRNIVKSGEASKSGHPVTRKRRGWSFPTLPRSTLVNFVAIALLFAVIFALQQIGSNLRKESRAVPTEPQAVTVNLEEIETTAVTPETTETTETVAVVEKTTGATTAVVTLEEETTEETVEAPKRAEKRVARKSVKRRKRSTRRRSVARRDPYWQDRSMGVSDLDNEFARERYNTLNRKLSAEEVSQPIYEETIPAPTYSYGYNTPTYTQTSTPSYVNDLDGNSAREDYKAQNRKLSGPEANLD